MGIAKVKIIYYNTYTVLNKTVVYFKKRNVSRNKNKKDYKKVLTQRCVHDIII